MINRLLQLPIILCFLMSIYSCTADPKVVVPVAPEMVKQQDTITTVDTIQTTQPNLQKMAYDYLALGDSYTIGESVCSTCRFPEQLKTALQQSDSLKEVNIKVIARTGWTTTQLIDAITKEELPTNYDLVTLLIGVNNQFQNKDFTIYETEFIQLVNKAIVLAEGDKTKVVVVSIPDYAFTPFGQGSSPDKISSEIDRYNAFAKTYCESNAIPYVGITDITRRGLVSTELVATDGLHPSKEAYAEFVSRLLPPVTKILN